MTIIKNEIKTFQFVEVISGEKEYQVLTKNGDFEFVINDELKKFLDLVKSTLDFYENEGENATKFIRHENMLDYLSQFERILFDFRFSGLKEISNYFYEVPYITPNYREFRKNLKSDWSFKCDHCLNKISSKDKKGYYEINGICLEGLYGLRFCSEICGEIYTKEILKEQLKMMGHKDFFDM